MVVTPYFYDERVSRAMRTAIVSYLLNEYFIKYYNEESDEGYFLEVDVQYPEKLHELHNDSPFLSEKMKIEKIEKFVINLHDKI